MTLLAEVKGWSPVIHSLASQPEIGLVTAAVYGAVWRYCQLKDGACKARLETIGDDLGIDKATVQRHIKKLCDKGYLKDETPDLRNVPHVYSDTGKAKIIGYIEAQTVAQDNTLTVADNNSSKTIAHSNATVAHSNATVAESRLNRLFSRLSEKKTITTTRDEAGQKLTDIYLLTANGKVSQYGVDLINDILDSYSPEVVIYACNEAEKNTTPSDDKRNLSYVEAVCKRKASGQPDKPKGQGTNGHRRSYSQQPPKIPTTDEQARFKRMQAAVDAAANDAGGIIESK